MGDLDCFGTLVDWHNRFAAIVRTVAGDRTWPAPGLSPVEQLFEQEAPHRLYDVLSGALQPRPRWHDDGRCRSPPPDAEDARCSATWAVSRNCGAPAAARGADELRRRSVPDDQARVPQDSSVVTATGPRP
jgi:hypothetical protein